ncbi:MAG: lasso peptide biosynthesis B2 protein [Gaiellaceae bacterium MAG52_C11]|nr:lasso peptide biosynthesis B2 protein [Candidatus Gaiellasilicea maunaloa]
MIDSGPLPLSRKVALAGEIVAEYVRVRWILRRLDLPRTLELIRAVAPAELLPPRPTDERLAGAVRRTLRRLPADSRCLMQSLVLTRLLARRGRESTLVIGVSPAGRFSAHAWVERDGVPLLPAHRREFGRLAEL